MCIVCIPVGIFFGIVIALSITPLASLVTVPIFMGLEYITTLKASIW
jgi:hypothetical protein